METNFMFVNCLDYYISLSNQRHQIFGKSGVFYSNFSLFCTYYPVNQGCYITRYGVCEVYGDPWGVMDRRSYRVLESVYVPIGLWEAKSEARLG